MVVIVDFLTIVGIRRSLSSSILSLSVEGILFSKSILENSDDVFDSFLELLSFRVMFLKNETEDNAIPPIIMKNLFKMISPVQQYSV